MPPKSGNYVETQRYVVLSPNRGTGGRVLGVTVQGLTVQPPANPSGPVMRVTFRVPVSLFEPFDATITVAEDQTLGSPKAIVADLNKLKEELEG